MRDLPSGLGSQLRRAFIVLSVCAVIVGAIAASSAPGSRASARAVAVASSDPVANYVTTVSEDTPVAWWRMESSSSGLLDSAGAHNGTFSGTAPTVAGSLPPKLSGSSSLSFNGTSQYASVPYAADLNASAFSVEAWMKPSGTGSRWILQSGRLSSPLSGYELFRSSSTLTFRVYAGSTSTTLSTSGIVAGRTYHVVGVFDGQRLVLYVNGRTVATAAATLVAATSGPTYVGARGTSPVSGFFTGELDEVAVYDHALAELRACRHYVAGAAIYDPEALSDYGSEVMADCAVGYWPLNDASGNATDAAGLGHPATPQGTPSYLAQGPYGWGAVGLNGVSGYSLDDAFVVPNSAGTLDGFAFPGKRPYSLEAWIKISDCPPASKMGGLVEAMNPSTSYGYTLRLRDNCRLDFARAATSQTITPNGTVPLGSWAHVVATYDGETMRIYVDGNLVQLATSTLSDPGGTDAVLGQAMQSSGYRNYFVGSLAHMAIYGRALSSADVARHHSAMSSAADLTLTQIGWPYATTGETVSYRLDVTNAGPGAARAVQLTATIPSGITVLNATVVDGPPCSTLISISCDLGFIPSSSTKSVSVLARLDAEGNAGSLATITSPTPDPLTDGNTLDVRTVGLRPEHGLASDFRPALLFDSGSSELWRPVAIDGLLSESFNGARHQICDAFNQCVDITDESGFSLAPHHLDIHGSSGEESFTSAACRASDLNDCDSGPQSVLYYEPTTDPNNGYRYFDYWWFYRWNNSPVITGDHEGDWEGVTVVVDPTGPPANTGSPVAAYALYASHADLTWSAYLGNPANAHTPAYIGQGTHSSNPSACLEDCGEQIAFGVRTERSYDGARPWGRNNDAECNEQCVEPLRDHEATWTFWGGRWGPHDEGNVQGGASPASPGNQTRYQCVKNLFTGFCPAAPVGPSSLRMLSTKAASRNAGFSVTRCDTWKGDHSAVVWCDDAQLKRAHEEHALDERIAPGIQVEGFRGRVLAAPGLTQAIGQPLRAGDAVKILGPSTEKRELMIRVRRGQSLWMATIAVPAIGARDNAVVSINDGPSAPTFELTLPNGRTVTPVAVRRVR